MYQVIKNDLSNDLMPFDKQVKRTDEPLPNGYTIHIISGSKGTGKTTLVLNLLKRRSSPYYKQFDNIYLISPTAGRDPKMDSLIDELKMDDKFYTELNDENLNEIMRRLVEFNEDFLKKVEEKREKKKKIDREQPRNLIILDDCIHMLPSGQSKTKFNELITQSRHYKTCLMILTQKYNKCNTLIRSNADLITWFPNTNKKDFEALQNDLNINPDMLDSLYKYATDTPNSFLHISFFGGKPTFFKKFDKIILNSV